MLPTGGTIQATLINTPLPMFLGDKTHCGESSFPLLHRRACGITERSLASQMATRLRTCEVLGLDDVSVDLELLPQAEETDVINCIRKAVTEVDYLRFVRQVGFDKKRP